MGYFNARNIRYWLVNIIYMKANKFRLCFARENHPLSVTQVLGQGMPFSFIMQNVVGFGWFTRFFWDFLLIVFLVARLCGGKNSYLIVKDSFNIAKGLQKLAHHLYPTGADRVEIAKMLVQFFK